MSVVMVVNEKWRERVLAWGAFETLPDNFPFFFQRLLDACLSPLEVLPLAHKCRRVLYVPSAGFQVYHEREDDAPSLPSLLLQ